MVVVRHPVVFEGTWTDGPVFSWSQPYSESETIIREADGSGALQVFQGLLFAARWNASFLDSAPKMTAWVSLDAGAYCGTCYIPWSRTVVISDVLDHDYRSDATLFHEFGHYYFDVAGNSVSFYEAGTHCLGVPVPASQALHEGHATWYAAELLGDSRIYSEAFGTFFYWDIGARSTPFTQSDIFKEPDLEAGLGQMVNETWVSAVLWDLGKAFGSSTPIHQAFLSREVREPSRYTAKTWSRDRCEARDPVESGVPAPILAEVLDALVCNGFPSDLVDGTVLPHYPYDSSAPLCRDEGN